jgi:hypothetical protein
MHGLCLHALSTLWLCLCPPIVCRRAELGRARHAPSRPALCVRVCFACLLCVRAEPAAAAPQPLTSSPPPPPLSSISQAVDEGQPSPGDHTRHSALQHSVGGVDTRVAAEEAESCAAAVAAEGGGEGGVGFQREDVDTAEANDAPPVARGAATSCSPDTAAALKRHRAAVAAFRKVCFRWLMLFMHVFQDLIAAQDHRACLLMRTRKIEYRLPHGTTLQGTYEAARPLGDPCEVATQVRLYSGVLYSSANLEWELTDYAHNNARVE